MYNPIIKGFKREESYIHNVSTDIAMDIESTGLFVFLVKLAPASLYYCNCIIILIMDFRAAIYTRNTHVSITKIFPEG